MKFDIDKYLKQLEKTTLLKQKYSSFSDEELERLLGTVDSVEEVEQIEKLLQIREDEEMARAEAEWCD